MAFHGHEWFIDLETDLDIVEAFERGSDAAARAGRGLAAQVVAHQGQGEGQAADRVSEIVSFLRLAIHRLGGEQAEEFDAIFFIELANDDGAIDRHIGGDVGEAGGDEVGAVGAAHA